MCVSLARWRPHRRPGQHDAWLPWLFDLAAGQHPACLRRKRLGVPQSAFLWHVANSRMGGASPSGRSCSAPQDARKNKNTKNLDRDVCSNTNAPCPSVPATQRDVRSVGVQAQQQVEVVSRKKLCAKPLNTNPAQREHESQPKTLRGSWGLRHPCMEIALLRPRSRALFSEPPSGSFAVPARRGGVAATGSFA